MFGTDLFFQQYLTIKFININFDQQYY